MTRLAEYVVLGLSLGVLYALMGMGVTVVYQAARVPNVAFVAIGTVAAVLHWDLVSTSGRIGWTLGWWPAFAVTLMAAAILGMVTDLLVRPLAGRVVASLLLLVAWMATLLAAANALWGSQAKLLPGVWGGPPLAVGDFSVPRQQVASLLIGGVCALAFVALMRRSRLGLALRASAGDSEAAGMMGMDPARLSRSAWCLSSVLAAVAVILIVHPVLSNTYEQAVYVPFAFGAALLGGFRSLPLAALGGMALGVVPALFEPTDGLVEIGGVRNLVAFALIAGLLLRRPRIFDRLGEPVAPDGAHLPALGERLPAVTHGLVRRAGFVALAAVLAIGVPALSTDRALEAWTHGLAVFLVCASIVVVSGWTGEVPLGQVAFAGVGAFMAANLAMRLGLPHIVAFPLAAASAVPFALLAGIPAFRARGRLPFAAVSIGLTVVASSFLWGPGSRWFTGSRPVLERPDWMEVIWGRPAASYYLVALAIAAGVILFTTNLRRSRIGRAFAAVRDSDAAARSLGIDPTRYRLVALAFSAFVAGLGGVLHAYLAGEIDPTRFAAFLSIQYLLYTLVGGSASLAGTAAVVWAFEVLPVLGGRAPGSGPGVVAVLGFLALAAVRFAPGGLAGVVSWLGTPRRPALATVAARPGAGESRYGEGDAFEDFDFDFEDFDGSGGSGGGSGERPEPSGEGSGP